MIIANFGNEKEKYVSGLWQYDYGQVLRIQGLNLPTAVEIHFSIEEKGGTSQTRIGVSKDGVTDVVIPDSMLENNDTNRKYTIYAFVYLTDDKSGETIRKIYMTVESRPKPEAFDRPEDIEIFREAIKAVNESAARSEESEKQAEGWAHGREDLPERAQDNAKYYSDQAKEDSIKTDADRKEVERLVESVSGIDEQVAKVEGLTKQAQTSATNAALSEQAAKESESGAVQAKEGAEAAQGDAEKSAQKTAEDRTAVESAKEEVLQAKTDVEADRKAVEEIQKDVSQTGNTILEAVQEGVQAIENAGIMEKQEISQAGTTQKSAVENAGVQAIEGINLAKQTAVEDVQAEGTTQTGNVAAEGEKQVQAVQRAAQEIMADREQINTNKTEVAQLKKDITALAPRVYELEKKTAKYSDQFFENFFAMQRTGKKYTVRFPLWETSQVSTGEKLDDNAGLVMEASTLTEKGRDDYADIPLFKTYDCNVEKINGKLKITAMKGDVGFDPKEKDTFVLGMPYYHKVWVKDGYLYYSRSDTPHEGYMLCKEAEKEKGMRNFCLYAKYVAGRNSKDVLGSYCDTTPVRNIFSHNGCINEGKKRGTEYVFGSSLDYSYIQNTFLLKYADRNWNKFLGGNFASSGNQFIVSMPEANAKRVVLAKANAEKFPIGSSVSVGDLDTDANKDRSNAKLHNICDNVKIIDIVEVDVGNKALVLDIPNNITTTAATWVTSMHWNSGFSDNILGTDGCPCRLKSQIPSMLYPSVIQGIELMVGGYEVLGTAFMDVLADPLVRDVYVCDDSEKLTTDTATAKKNYKKLQQQLRVEKNNAWCYGTEIHMDLDNGINVITKSGLPGSGSSTGFCDGIYFDNSTNTQREFLLLGSLGSGGMCGAFCSFGVGLGYAWWSFLARLSLNVYRGEFA